MTMRAGLWDLGFYLCGLTLLAIDAWQYFSPADEPGLIVDETDCELTDILAGQTKVITFPFHNRATHPVQIVGLAPC